MSAMRLETRLALCAGLGLFFVACGSAPAEENVGGAGANVPLIDNFPGSAGQRSGDGFKGWSDPNVAGTGGATAAAGSAGSAGKPSAAGSGGGQAGVGGAAGAPTGPAAGSGTTAPEEDPFDIFGMGSAGAPAEDPLDLFGGMPGMVSCTGLLCAELADCQNLYPTEHAACKFTQCVDLECK